MSKTVRIPERIVPLEKKLKEGTSVVWGEQPIYEQNQSLVVVEVAQELKIPSRDIFKYIHVSLGQVVEKDAVIAERKSLLQTMQIIAPAHGEVRAIDHDAGTVTLMTSETSHTHFAFSGTFQKSEKQELVFTVPEGAEYEVLTSINGTCGAKTAYIATPEEITLAGCDGKIVVTSLTDTMALSKIMALGPVALVTGKALYTGLDIISLVLKHNADWNEVQKKRWPYALYIEGSKSIYFYRD